MCVQGAEAEAARAKVGRSGEDKEAAMRRLVAGDLADSDDDDDLNKYGQEVKAGLARVDKYGGGGVQARVGASGDLGRKSVVGGEPARGEMVRPTDSAPLDKRLQGKTVLTERYSRLRITSPKVVYCILFTYVDRTLIKLELCNQVSQAQLVSMIGSRRFAALNTLSKAPEGDWVTIGVLFYKAPPKTSASGKDFSVWKLTDLRGNCLPVSIFLFGRAHKEHWKVPLHKVVGILNPKVLDDNAKGGAGSKEGLTLSIDHPDALLELGDSADIGKCAQRKADGSGCQQIVNLAECQYCVHHVRQAYKSSAGQRQSLQSSFSGSSVPKRSNTNAGSRDSGGGFGGNDYKPVIGKKSAKSRARDNQLLAGLGGPGGTTINEVSQMVVSGRDRQGRPRGAGLSHQQKEVVQMVSSRVSEELGARLLAPTPGARALLGTMTKDKEEEKKAVLAPMSAKELLLSHKKSLTPTLGRGAKEGSEISLDLSPSVKARYAEAGHAKALAILAMRKKTIEKKDPNAEHRVKNRVDDIKGKVQKRLRSDEDVPPPWEINSPAAKKPKVVTAFGREISVDKLEELRNKKSANSHLAEEAELDAADKYFDKAVMREGMEEKMLSTTSVQIKAVTCSICNYTSYKASDICREKGHRVKVINAKKRFFKCADCKNRTQSLDRLPKESCSKCGGSRWEKAGMIGERKGPKLDSEQLSIRGNEEKYLGSTAPGQANIDI